MSKKYFLKTASWIKQLANTGSMRPVIPESGSPFAGQIPMGKVLAPSLNPTDIILVNDLDIRLIKLDDSSVYEPFILAPETPDAPAQTGDNFRDNIEQIYIPSSEKGYYDLKVYT